MRGPEAVRGVWMSQERHKGLLGESEVRPLLHITPGITVHMHSQATGVSQPLSIVLGAEEPAPARRAGRSLASPPVGGSIRRHHAGCGSLYISLLLHPQTQLPSCT